MLAKVVNDTSIQLDSTVNISGHVKIENGDTVIEGKNKLTSAFLMNLVSCIAANRGSHTHSIMANITNTTYSYMYLGSDTTHPTNNTTAALFAPIGSPTKCNTLSVGSLTSGNDNYINMTGVWSVGTVSGTVGELGLYLLLNDGLLAAGSDWTYSGARLVARFSVADSEMSSFVIDTTKPVVITWTFKFSSDLKFVNQGTAMLANVVSDGANSGDYPRYWPSISWTGKTTYMVIGSNTTTGNTASMTTLTTPIGTPPGTRANTQSFATSTVAVGSYRVSYVATWNAGTVSGTLGEIGLFLHCPWNTMSAFSSWDYRNTNIYMVARLNSYDGHFASFTIDAAKALTITWNITFTFA